MWPRSDAIWWHRSGSAFAQVMACCLTAPSHYVNQCWLGIQGMCHSAILPKSNVILAKKITFDNDIFKTFGESSKGQWVKQPPVHGAKMGPTWSRLDQYSLSILDSDGLLLKCMMTSSNRNIFCLAIYAGNPPAPGEFPAQRPVTRSFDVFFDLRLNKWLSKQWWGWWFEMPSHPLWRHCNGISCPDVNWKYLRVNGLQGNKINMF